MKNYVKTKQMEIKLKKKKFYLFCSQKFRKTNIHIYKLLFTTSVTFH